LADEADRFCARHAPANVQVSNIPNGKELGAMLEAGEIEALISADNPSASWRTRRK
jgi:4,5-dihydroxyphthalate decarboxylase